MLNNPLYLNQASLEAIYLPKDGEVAFNKGELLQGHVKGINPDGLVTLWLKGRLVAAATQVKVMPGQSLLLMVDRVDAGQIHLKVLNPTGLQKNLDQNIAARLVEMGIPARDSHIQLAGHLLAYNLPVNQSTLTAMLKGLALLGKPTEENMNLVAFQISRDLPQHPLTLSALAQYVDPDSNINSLRQEIMQLFSASLNARAPEQQGGAVPHTANAAIFGQVGEAAAQRLTRSAGQDKIIWPASITAATSSLPVGSSLTGLTSLLGSSGILGQALNAVLPALGGQGVEAAQSPPVLASQISQMLQSRPELLRGLLLLQSILEVSIKAGQLKQNAPLFTKLQAFSRELLGQQLMNIAPPAPQGEALQYYFAFPVQLGEEQRLCEFKVYAEKGQKSLKDCKQLKIAVSLDTAELGPVVFHITWHSPKLLELRSLVTKDISYQRMMPHLPELHRALRGLGYTVRDYGMRIVAPGQDDKTLKVIPQPAAGVNRMACLKVDIKI